MRLEHEEYVMKLYNYLKSNPVKDAILDNDKIKIVIYGNIINFLNSNANEQPRNSLKKFLIMPNQNYLKQESILTILDNYNNKKIEEDDINILFQKQSADKSNLDYAYISNFITGFNDKIISNEDLYSFCLNLDRENILNKNELYEYLLLFLNKNVDIINEKAELYYNSSIKKEPFLSQIYSKIITYLDNQNRLWSDIKKPLDDAINITDELKKYYLIDFNNINGCFFFKETFEYFKNIVISNDFELYKLENLKLFLFIKLIGKFFGENVKNKNYDETLVKEIDNFKKHLESFYNKQKETNIEGGD